MGALASVASVGLNAALGARAADQEADARQADRDRQIEEIRRRSEEETRERKNRLRSQLASERARAGAAGTLDSQGSAGAVLEGLRREATAEQRFANAERNQEIDTLFRETSRRNRDSLLNRSSGFLKQSFGVGSSRRNRSSLLNF